MSIKNLETPVQYLKGVGPKMAKLFKKLGVTTVQDLLYFFPRDYEDRSHPELIAKLTFSEPQVTVRGEVEKVGLKNTKGRFSILKVLISDKTGSINAVFFNQPFLARLFRPNMKLIITGKPEINLFEGKGQLTVRDYEIDTGKPLAIIPIYPLTEGMYPKYLRNLMGKALEEYLPQIEDLLPVQLKKKHKLMDLVPAIKEIHLPQNLSKVEPAKKRIVFEELLCFQLGLLLRRKEIKEQKGITFAVPDKLIADFIANLPFELTGAQQKVFEEIKNDMSDDRPMNRLLQGDVGSGKTIIAALASLIATNNGYQVAIMAPTEILANQHYQKLSKLLSNLKVELVTGTTQKKKEIKEIEESQMIIGTHALLEEKIKFKKLGLVIIDEQHRFGVMQRASLAQKSYHPDLLFMTATPIPRSLALSVYGDLDRSIIDEMPKGRVPIKTLYVPKRKRADSYEFIRGKIKEGEQVYVVCPLVEESEELDLKAASEEAERLKNEIFPEFKVGLIHGRMKGVDKDRIMEEFKSGKLNILVSTTVIEVGIDVPNASIMIIEHAERFGLSQLHQLRGRIGRGAKESFCLLMADPKGEEAKLRIKAIVDHTDGFKIAEIDLQLRGPGEVFGLRQAGLPAFALADIIRDEETLRSARSAAAELIKEDPKLASDLWIRQGKTIKSS